MKKESFKTGLIPLYYYHIYEKSVEIRGSRLQLEASTHAQ